MDADALAHKVMEPGGAAYTKVLQAFGPNLTTTDGRIDRARLAKLVFSDKTKLSELENIVHPAVRSETELEKLRLEKSGAAIAFYDVPLLYEKSMADLFDSVVVVVSREANQRLRMAGRNGWSKDEIDRRLATQLPIAEKQKRADFVISNDGSMEELEQELDRVLKNLYQAHE